MIRGSKHRRADHPIHPLFLDRWSPRQMSAESMPEADLHIMLEAARWAPSSYNAQPWGIVFALRDGPHWPAFLGLLDDGNRSWAQDAAALLVVVSRSVFERNGRRSRTHSLDAGAAWENLALQGTLLGYVVHGMEGFDYERARTALGIPQHYDVEMMAAVGRPVAATAGPDVEEEERPSDRKPLADIAFEGTFKGEERRTQRGHPT